jgi:hypothetical protein
MGKTLNIKNPQTYEMVAKLAALTGLSMTQAVKQAVILKLEALKQREQAQQSDMGSLPASGSFSETLPLKK